MEHTAHASGSRVLLIGENVKAPSNANALIVTPASIAAHRLLWMAFLRPSAETEQAVLEQQREGSIAPPRLVWGNLGAEVVTLRGNEVYRIAEVYRGHALLEAKIKASAEYEGTILQRWLKEGGRAHDAASLLLQVRRYMEEHGLQPLRGLVVHIRAGDACSKFGLGRRKVRLQLQRDIDARLGQSTYMTVITALHYGVAEQSSAYKSQGPHPFAFSSASQEANLKELRSFIEAQRVPVLIKSSASIDEDFCLLCSAEQLVHSGGNFSQMVAKLNRLYRGR